MRASAVHQAMQNALDGAGLAVVHRAAQLTTAQLNSQASAYFQQSFQRPEAPSPTVTAAFDSSTGLLTLTGSVAVPTVMMSIVGMNSVPVAALAKVQAAATQPCVMALDPVAKNAFAISGNGSVSVPNCGIYVLSS